MYYVSFSLLSIPFLTFPFFLGTSDTSTSFSFFSECKGEFTFSSLVLNVLDSWLEFLTKDYAISCLSARSRSFGRIRRFHTSPPDLVDKSLAFLELSKLCHLSLHCVPVLNDENEFTSSHNLFSSRAISFNF